jgi:hypothetical protein
VDERARETEAEDAAWRRFRAHDEADYWRRYRAYVRRKAAARMALILLPFWLVTGFLWALQTAGYAPDDPRSDLLWRFAVMTASDVFFIVLVVFSVRWLLADRRGEKRPPWEPTSRG